MLIRHSPGVTRGQALCHVSVTECLTPCHVLLIEFPIFCLTFGAFEPIICPISDIYLIITCTEKRLTMDELDTLRILNETINRKMGLPRIINGSPELAAGDLVVLYALLTEDRPLTQSEIARFLFKSRQTINSSLQKMHQQGFLELVPGEGRKKRIVLTQKGKEITQQYVTPVFQMEIRALSCLSGEERTRFAELLVKFGDALTRESDSFRTVNKKDQYGEDDTNGTDSVCK